MLSHSSANVHAKLTNFFFLLLLLLRRANLTKAVKPEVDKSCRAVKYGEGSEVPDCPPPLVPFAGCDRKAMAPSPAKPFSLTASPLKPSPFKERVDTATEAVVRKNWSSRQAKMGAFFTAPKDTQDVGPPQQLQQQAAAAQHPPLPPTQDV
jgi:hypothetical protein